MEARVCQCGCGRELRLKNGDPDFKRRFYSKECLARDKRRRTAFARELFRRKERGRTLPAPEPPRRATKRFWIQGRRGVSVGVHSIEAAHLVAQGMGKDLAAVLVGAQPKRVASSLRPATRDLRPSVAK